jgi:hypothetical protein
VTFLFHASNRLYLNVPIPDRVKEFRENPEKLEKFAKLVQSFIRTLARNNRNMLSIDHASITRLY